jgi:hypothetical protein
MKYIDIYERVIKYYPLGINELEPIYQEYSGYKLLQELCYEKLNSVKSNQWAKLVSDLKSSFSSIIYVKDETESIQPSYSCSLILCQNKVSNILYQKAIRLHVSILGPFYTAYGLDTIQIYDAYDNALMETQPILSVSPLDDYKDSLPLVRDIIKNIYAEHSYVPFYYLKKRVKALSVAGVSVLEGNGASVFQALFTSEDIANYKLRGDIHYE